MSRKRKSRKSLAPRNPFVAVAIMKKAGSHRKSNKALRREQQIGLAAQRQSIRLLTDRPQFDSGQAHHQECFRKLEVFVSIFSHG